MTPSDDITEAVVNSGIHEEDNGYTGNCANVAVAIREIALEEYGDDIFRFAVIDRPNRLDIGVGGPDHVALEYEGRYLDSKGMHSRQEIIDLIRGEDKDKNMPMIQIESRSFVEGLPYYDLDVKDRIKSKIKKNL